MRSSPVRPRKCMVRMYSDSRMVSPSSSPTQWPSEAWVAIRYRLAASTALSTEVRAGERRTLSGPEPESFRTDILLDPRFTGSWFGRVPHQQCRCRPCSAQTPESIPWWAWPKGRGGHHESRRGSSPSRGSVGVHGDFYDLLRPGGSRRIAGLGRGSARAEGSHLRISDRKSV